MFKKEIKKSRKFLKSILGQKTANFLRRLLKYHPENEPESQEDIKKRQEFYSQFIKQNDLVFDAGANVGNRVNPLLNIGAKVIAIEPQKKCYEILKSRFGSRIEIVPMGLGETEEIKDFFIADVHTISSFSPEWIESVKKDRFKDYKWSEPVKIQITTLNKLIEKYGKPKFIKIDVEGYELEVLKGLTDSVDIISYEYAVPEQIQKAKDCLSQIEKYNPDVECNFSTGESMRFSLGDWQSVAEFKNFISTKEFISTDFGDIYVRTKKPPTT